MVVDAVVCVTNSDENFVLKIRFFLGISCFKSVLACVVDEDVEVAVDEEVAVADADGSSLLFFIQMLL